MRKSVVTIPDESQRVKGLIHGNLEEFFNELIEMAKKYDNLNDSILNDSIFVNA